jgi:oxygen-dependent protoporphyrinogen oxidase
LRDYDFIIIGAGLAGLSAHHELLKKGHSVLTIEAEDIPGGRVRTEKIGKGFSDTGAQFFTYNYPRILKLCREFELETHAASSLMGQKEKDKNYLVETKNPLSAMTSGLLTPLSWVKLMKHVLKLKLTPGKIHPEDPMSLFRYDDNDARTYILKHLNQEILRKVFIPYFSAFNYASPEELSSALVVRALLHLASGKPLMGLAGGLATLPRALAAGKEISFGTRVERIEGRKVVTNKGEFHGARIIVATTARVARELLQSHYPGNLNQKMCPSVHEAILVKKRKLDGSYGTLISPEKNPDFNVMTNERFKAPGLSPEGQDLFGILRSREGAAKERVAGAEELLGIMEKDILERKKTIWKEAIPVLSPGHLRAVTDYRKSLSPAGTYFLAGDYLSTGCAEGAVESGQFIAGLFASRL